MPREISGLRIARSFVSPIGPTAVTRELDFQLGARQGISIHAIQGAMVADPSDFAPSTATITEFLARQTVHLETGSLENVPLNAGDDEDTIDSEVFYRQDLWIGGNDDSTTEFRASLASYISPSSIVNFPRPLFAARNITHSAITSANDLGVLANVIIYYTFVEFSLAELGLILARRT